MKRRPTRRKKQARDNEMMKRKPDNKLRRGLNLDLHQRKERYMKRKKGGHLRRQGRTMTSRSTSLARSGRKRMRSRRWKKKG
jgi:hypothetical protein